MTEQEIQEMRAAYPLIRYSHLYPQRLAWLESTAAENAELLAISEQIKAERSLPVLQS